MKKDCLALLILVAIPACGGGDSSISLSDLPAKSVDAVCNFLVRCGQMPDKASCVAAMATDMGQTSAEVNAGRVKYDGKAAAACLDVFSSSSCNYSEQGVTIEPQACKDAIQGTVAAGGVCYSGAECVSQECGGGVCSGNGCCPGTCSAGTSSVGSIPIGGNCNQDMTACGDGAYCSYSSMTPTCQARVAVGQSCDVGSGTDQCLAGSYCVAGAFSTGTCGKLPAEGETCYPTTYASACDSLLDFCDPTTVKCIRKIPPGGDCPWGVGCVDWAFCDSSGTCVAMGKVGDVCDSSGSSDNPTCLGELQCSSGHCAQQPAISTTCP